MMFQNNNRQQNPYYSETIRHRLEFMRQNADKLFSLGWLRKQLWKELCVRLPELEATEYGDYAQQLHGNPEIRFILEFLSVYKKSLPEIRTIIGNPYDTKAPIIDLLEKREVFIEEFAHIPFSDGWECVKNDNQSWRSFVRRLYTKAQEDMTHFFEVLDMISIITDIVCERASEYGLNVDYSPLKDYDLEQRKKALTDEVLARAIEAVRAHINSKSMWASVYCVMRDDYGNNVMKQFEDDMMKLPFKEDLQCSEGTISRTMSNHKFLRMPIEKWPPQNKFTKLAKKIREAIEEELSK